MQRGMTVSKLLAWVLSFVLILTMTIQPVFGWPWDKEEPAPAPEAAEPDLKLYARCEPVPATLSTRTLRASGASFADAKALYDGDETTVFTNTRVSEITLDLGGVHMLGGVRFLPVAGEKEADINRCLGTAFYLSADNRNFQKAVTAEPVNNENYAAQWHELMFGGAGEFRYVKIQIPAGAQIAEVQWLAYPEWQYQQVGGESRWKLRLYGYDAQKELEARLVAGVYSPQGVLKAISVTDHTFLPGQDSVIDIQLSAPKREIGDSYRVMAWESDGRSLLAQNLTYRYTKGSAEFSMSNLFSDDMMFQADKPLTVWGKAPTGSKVQVKLVNSNGGGVLQETEVKTGSDWEVELGSFSAGGSYTLTVTCGGEEKVFENITFGDIWLLTGQSNMDYHLLGGADTIAYLESEQGKQETDNPEIRLLNLWTKGTGGAGAAVENLPIGYVNPAWSMMNYDAASYCSAVGYFFAQQIQTQCRIPVGIMNVAVGDTEINRWIPYGTKTGSFTSTDGGLYYNRVLPFAKLQIRGILMYQGEADEYRTHLSTGEYRDALSGLVDLYRDIWGEDLPFYWAQLTRYKSDESLIREGQRLALDAISNPENAGMISLMDIYGEYEAGAGNCREDIHPHQKKEVADRFLRYAKRDVYGEPDIVVSGPVYESIRRVGNRLELTFACQGGLTVLPKERYADAQGQKWIADNHMDTGKPQEFEVAGSDGVFYQAEAEIRGNTILLTSSEVKNPVQARYAWGAYPEMPNLTDGSGLPAPAFVTDKLN